MRLVELFVSSTNAGVAKVLRQQTLVDFERLQQGARVLEQAHGHELRGLREWVEMVAAALEEVV